MDNVFVAKLNENTLKSDTHRCNGAQALNMCTHSHK